MQAALRRFADAIDASARAAGLLSAALQPLLVASVIATAVLRYGFGRGSIALEELQWHLFAASVVLAFADTYAANEHVRVDVLAARFSPRTRAAIELAGCLLLLFPFAAYTADAAFEFFWRSLRFAERSPMPSGLPARFLIKGVLCGALGLLALEALAVAARNALLLLGGSPTGDAGRAAAPSGLRSGS